MATPMATAIAASATWRDLITSPIHAALTEGSVRLVDDEVFWRKDGTKFPVESTCTPIHVISLTAFANLTADAALNPDGGIAGSVKVMFADGTSNTATFNLLPAVQNIT